jgi:molecular chaperone GrpE
MSRKRTHHEDATAPESFDDPEGFGEQAPDAMAPESDVSADDPVARLTGEAASLKDQLLRALAETENLRRRSTREREDAVKYAAVPLVRDLVTVADNLHRALASVPAEAAQGNEQLKTLLDGVEMTDRELQTIFARHHIERIEPMGERLDPHFHEALYEIPDPNAPAGTVLQVLLAGYRLRDRLIRPAQVAVAKGGRSTATATATENPAPESPANDGADGPGQREPGRRFDTSA